MDNTKTNQWHLPFTSVPMPGLRTIQRPYSIRALSQGLFRGGNRVHLWHPAPLRRGAVFRVLP
jgi:hypothetical protein